MYLELKILLSLFLAAPLFAWTSNEVILSMSLEEKIGQLIVAPACPNRLDGRHLDDLSKAVEHWHIGSFLLKQGTLRETSELIQRMKGLSHFPLLLAADAEWGLAMRISDAPKYPRNMTLAAMGDSGRIEQMGHEIGEQMRYLGIHLNLAPVADVNSNPKNPIIYTRAFGDDPAQVAKCSSAMVRGMQKTGTLTCAKHFPGHGDTLVDSHVALPTIDKNLAAMQQIELLPFKILIDQGVDCVMTAHLLVPAVDDKPVTLSKVWVTGILREKLGFEGLIITDALNMDGIAKGRDAGEVAIQAFLAGHDLLLYGDHIAPRIDEILEEMIPTAISALKKAVLEGRIALEELDRRVAKILAAKQKLPVVGSHAIKATSPKTFYREALTAIGQLPSLKTIQIVEIGSPRAFSKLLEKEGLVVEQDADWHILVMGEIERGTIQDKQFALQALKACQQHAEKSIVVLFGSPYNLAYIPSGVRVLLAYEDTIDAWEAAALALASKIPCRGQLPIRFKNRS